MRKKEGEKESKVFFKHLYNRKQLPRETLWRDLKDLYWKSSKDVNLGWGTYKCFSYAIFGEGYLWSILLWLLQGIISLLQKDKTFCFNFSNIPRCTIASPSCSFALWTNFQAFWTLLVRKGCWLQRSAPSHPNPSSHTPNPNSVKHARFWSFHFLIHSFLFTSSACRFTSKRFFPWNFSFPYVALAGSC